jgi:hypothetical protein
MKLDNKLKKVVFPAPFGPIKPVILPVATSIPACRTALTPPKVLHSPWAESNG